MGKGNYLAELQPEKRKKLEPVFQALGLDPEQMERIRQFHEDGGGADRAYSVYRVEYAGREYVLKRSVPAEAELYHTYLEQEDFPVPKVYAAAQKGKSCWLLLEYVPGEDLREFTPELALMAAESLSALHNAYWRGEPQSGRENSGERFTRYWERIARRAKCLTARPGLEEAYKVFLERQKTCPLTLCSGDFLQYNALFTGERVVLIDWAFGGEMPYSLDLARLISHGSEERTPFPYYMTDELRRSFLRAYYGKMKVPPEYGEFLWDVVLSALNECVEFLEEDFLEPGGEPDEVYLARAEETAALIRKGKASFLKEYGKTI